MSLPSGLMRRTRNLVLGLVVLCSLILPARSKPLAPVGLAVNDRQNSIGIGTPNPLFSWLPRDSSPGEVQSAFQIRIASSEDKLKTSPDCWDSGKTFGAISSGIRYAGKVLASRQVCYWQVRTWNSRGEVSPWSIVARFELGLLDNQDWQAQWIWAENRDESEDYVYFRRTERLPAKPIARARAYVSAAHRQEFYLNGKLVGKGPNFAYPEYQYYQTFDLEPFLRSGAENAFGLLCHWYGSGQGRPYSSKGLLFQAIIDFTDGGSLAVTTDSSWKVLEGEWVVPEGKISRKNFRNGEGIPAETIDGRRHPTGWSLPGYDDSAWASAREIGKHPTAPWTGPLIAQETSIEEYEIRPVKINRLGPGHVVADFGKVYTGMPLIDFTDGQPGQVVTIKADYRVRADGTLEGFSQNTRMDYQYILRGGREEFRPYWYLGFRYLEVEDAPAGFDGSSIRMIVRHNQVDRDASSFECSNPTLNRIWDLVKRSLLLGSQEQFVDTPTREQGQFTYDAYQISIGSMKCFGDRLLSRQGLREFAQSQAKFHPDTGKVNAVYPNGDGKRDIPDWTQSFAFWAWEYYMETGDRELMKELFESLVKVAEYVKSTENKTTGLVDLGNDPGYAGGITDWPDRYGYDMTTTQRTVMSINAWIVYTNLARLAEELNAGAALVNRFKKYAEDIRTAIENQLWDDAQQAYIDGLYSDGSKSSHASQQANAMMLALGLPAPERRAGAMAAVKRAGHQTGPILARYLIQAYGDHDEDDALMEWLLNPEGNNFAYILADDGTFTYEHWRGRNSRSDGRGASESHAYSANAGVVAMQEYILGVKITRPGAARLQVRPHTAGLAFARGHIPTQSGRVSVSWQSGPRFRMELTLSCNVQADVFIPKGAGKDTEVKVDGKRRPGEAAGNYLLLRDIGSGRHVFER